MSIAATHGDHAHAGHGHGHGPSHPYHLVDPSPWPLVGSMAALLLTGGGVMWMHGHAGGPWLTLLGFLGVLYTMFRWWRDVLRESAAGAHSEVVSKGLRVGMALFIVSEVLFFFAFFWAFFWSALAPTPEIGRVWPPKGMEVLSAWEMPFLNTLMLLSSGASVTWAHHARVAGYRHQAMQALALTMVLAMVFTALQAFEYSHASFGFTQGIYPSTFFMATGFHGFHVIVGTIFLIVCWFRANRGDFKPDHHFGFEAAAWYWHFVDVVWLFLFICIYVGSSVPSAAPH